MAYGSLLEVEKELVQISAKPTKKSTERGCSFCPANKTKGINKVFNKVRGREIMVFASAPGQKENEDKKILVGSAGDFFFDELEKVGIKRTDCDLQYSVRCFPADRRDGQLYKRESNKIETNCCSVHNDEAILESKAKIYILLGASTHKVILGREYKKSKKVFWSETLKAKVYCLAHPNYFIGGYAPQIALDEFRAALKSINSDLDGKKISKYAYIEKQNYRAIRTVKGVRALKEKLLIAARDDIRIASDIETDKIDDALLYLCCGFSSQPGEADVVILDHPQARKVGKRWLPLKKKTRRLMHKITMEILTNPEIRKAFHQGASDVPFIEAYEEAKVRGYDYDTIYAEFFAHPDRRAYGLANIALQRYPQFGDYKTIILPECIPPGTDLKEHKMHNADDDKLYAYCGKNGLMHFSYLPLRKLVLRNGADCDITKRIELSTSKKINHSLLKVYRDAGFILSEMEANGPNFDYKQCDKLKELYPPKFEKVKDKLVMISGNKDFNPGAHQQVKDLLYKKLKIKPPEVAYDRKKKKQKDKYGNPVEVKPGTGKAVLEVLSRKHESAKLIQEYRRLSKIISTYINAYEMNANLHDGKLKTKWWLTGTQTGRLSSGGDKQVKEAKNENINLQNIHGDPSIQNLATADKEWRKLYKALVRAANKVCEQQLANLTDAIENPKYKDKDKNRKHTEALLERLKLKLYNSNRWKKLCDLIVKKYGEVRVLLGYDQGQIEVRVMGQASGDKNLIRDCMSSDIHSKVGHAMVPNWSVAKIKKDKKTRTLTKNIHFGILFGLSIEGLMAFIKLKDPDSDITEESAREMYDNYFKAYPGVTKFIAKMRAFVEKHGYVENMFGFKRPLKAGSVVEGYEMDDDDKEDQAGGAYWANQAVNTPIQGAAHMLMLMAIAILRRKKKKYASLGVPTLEVHDYIGWKTKLKDLANAYSLGKELLEKEPLDVVAKEWPSIKWLVPLVVEGKVGFRYGDSVECEDGKGKMKPLHHVLCDMMIETFTKEVKLEWELKKAA